MSYRIANNIYGSYCVPISSAHRPVSKKILSGQIHEPKTIDAIIKFAKHGDIVHAGTYFGDFLPALSKAIGGDLKIWAFEPNIENYYCCQITIKLNQLNNILLYNYALGADSCWSNLKIKRNNIFHGGISKIVHNSSQDTIPTQVVKLDNIIKSSLVSVIHLDLEGYEQSAMIGAMNLIKNNKPVIILETPPDDVWFKNNLYPLGYSQKSQIHNNYLFSVE